MLSYKNLPYLLNQFGIISFFLGLVLGFCFQYYFFTVIAMLLSALIGFCLFFNLQKKHIDIWYKNDYIKHLFKFSYILVGLFAIILAKHVIVSITTSNPIYYLDSIGMIALIYAFIVYAFFFQLILLILILFVFKNFIKSDLKENEHTSKKFSVIKFYKKIKKNLNTSIFLGLVSLCLIIIPILQNTLLSVYFYKYIILYTSYYPNDQTRICPKLEQNLYINFQDNDNVSVYNDKNDTFYHTKCEH